MEENLNNFEIMKTISKVLAFVGIAAIFAGCSKEIAEQNTVPGSKIQASFEAESGAMTKVAYELNGEETAYTCSWTEGDAVSLITENNTNAQFTKKPGSNEFSGAVSPWEGSKDIYCVWPYSSTAYTITDGKLSFDATSQTIVAGDQEFGSSLMVATANGECTALPGMNFKQAMAIIKMNITNVPAGVTVTKAAIINQAMYGNQTLTGSADIDMTTGAIVAESAVSTSSVTATVSGAIAGAATKVNFAVLPTTTAAKYSFVVTLSDGKVYKKTLGSAATFARNSIYTISYDLSVVKEEDILVMVVYNENGCVDLSGHQYTMKKTDRVSIATPSLYSSGCFDYVNRVNATSETICFAPVPVSAMASGYTVECFFVPTDITNSKEHKIVGFTNGAGACCGYFVKSPKASVEVNKTKTLIYTSQYTDSPSHEYFLYSEDYATVTGQEVSSINTWYHIVYTWDSASRTLQLFDSTTLFSGDIIVYPDTYHGIETEVKFRYYEIYGIGFGGNWNTNAAKAYVGPARVWNRALSKDEVKALFDAEPSGLADEHTWVKKN